VTKMMKKVSSTEFNHERHRWETLALLIVVGAVIIPAFSPIFGEKLFGPSPQEFLIRMYVNESGGFDPDLITVRRGEPVRLVLVSMDVTHSFAIPELNINSGPVHAGEKKVVEFTPMELGTFKFYCITACSPTHTFMNGKLVVT